MEYEPDEAKADGDSVHHLTSDFQKAVRQYLRLSHRLEGDVIGPWLILFVSGRMKLD